MASLFFAPSSFAGGVTPTTNQTVAQSGTIVTWTGDNAGADADTITEPSTGTVNIATTSGAIAIIPSTDADAHCTYDNVGQTAVTCTTTTQFAGSAGGGDDTVDASGLTSIFIDTLSGGNGNDTLTGGAVNDLIKGDGNDDTISGGDGNDDLKGGGGNDTVNGDAGNDSEVAGGTGTDIVNGGDGNDYMRGGPDADVVNGDAGNDYIAGACDIGCDSNVGTDDDTLNGGTGDDRLYGEDGNDTINGGDDVDYADGGIGDDTINGDAGDDSSNCNINGIICCFSGQAQPDLFCNYGGLYGGPGNDTIHGNDGNDYIDGYGGQSTLAVAQGVTNDADNLSGDAGNDEIYGEYDNDVISGGDGTDYADGGDGNDTISGDAGDDAYSDGYPYFSGGLRGGEGNDVIDGGTGIDSVEGDNGDDNLNGGPGDDAFHYSNNACPAGQAAEGCTSYLYGGVWGDNGNDTADGGDGRDYVSGGNDDDNVTGGAGDDTWHGWNLGYGSDSYSEYPGVYGNDGNDTVHGGDGSDYVEGGYGTDDTSGDAGDDDVYEEDDGSPDVAHGGAGIDQIEYWACCSGSPVSLTLNDVADDGEAANPDTKDAGDPGNNFASDLDNVLFDTNCNTNCQNGTTPNASVTIVGTSGANLLYGASGDDDITGLDGADYMSGAQGADTFHARDGYPDYIDCDAGVDTAIVDQFDTVHNCENVDVANVASAFDTSKPPVPPTPPANPSVKPDNTPPVVTLTVPKTTFTANQLVLGVRVSATCNEDCALSLRLLAQQQPGTATFARAKGYNVVVGRRSIGFGKSKKNIRVRPCERKPGGPQSQACLKRFKKAVNSRLKKSGKVTMKLLAVTTDRAGNRTTKRKTITIKRAVK